ncbi:MAG: DUF4296 domain-containing protein [Bacteroidetes bacterium]|nr:DUF4296 domain-containing protein [Bacteroidota bacterium]
MTKFVLISIISMLAGCSSEPALPLSREKLVDVLMDIHIAEAALAQITTGPKRDSLAELYYNQVAEIHGIDRETLDTSLAILQRNPGLMKDIYEQVLAEVEKKRLKK